MWYQEHRLFLLYFVNAEPLSQIIASGPDILMVFPPGPLSLCWMNCSIIRLCWELSWEGFFPIFLKVDTSLDRWELLNMVSIWLQWPHSSGCVLCGNVNTLWERRVMKLQLGNSGIWRPRSRPGSWIWNSCLWRVSGWPAADSEFWDLSWRWRYFKIKSARYFFFFYMDVTVQL